MAFLLVFERALVYTTAILGAGEVRLGLVISGWFMIYGLNNPFESIRLLLLSYLSCCYLELYIASE